MAAFGPMIFSPGTFGQIFGVIGLSAVLCLLFSLIESQLVLPAHLGHMKPTPTRDRLRAGSLQARWKGFQARMATSRTRAWVLFMKNVAGMIRVISMPPVRPGMAPTKTPRKVPRKTQNSGHGRITSYNVCYTKLLRSG